MRPLSCSFFIAIISIELSFSSEPLPNGAVVTVAQNVTTYGFTMATRNSDTAASFAQFTWVAFGCGIGCG